MSEPTPTSYRHSGLTWRRVIASRDLQAVSQWLDRSAHPRGMTTKLLFRAIRKEWDEGAAWLMRRADLRSAPVFRTLFQVTRQAGPALQKTMAVLLSNTLYPQAPRWAAEARDGALLDRAVAAGHNPWIKASAGTSAAEAWFKGFSVVAHMGVSRIDDTAEVERLDRFAYAFPPRPKDLAGLMLEACARRNLTLVSWFLDHGASATQSYQNRTPALALMATSMRSMTRSLNNPAPGIPFENASQGKVLMRLLEAGVTLEDALWFDAPDKPSIQKRETVGMTLRDALRTGRFPGWEQAIDRLLLETSTGLAAASSPARVRM